MSACLDPIVVTRGYPQTDDEYLRWLRFCHDEIVLLSPPPKGRLGLSPGGPEEIITTVSRLYADRLVALKVSYASIRMQHSFWGHHEPAIDLLRFRADGIFLGCAWFQYVEWFENLRHHYGDAPFRTHVEDGAFGVPITILDGLTVSRDLFESIHEIGFLNNAVGRQWMNKAVVLDIGAGYGRAAHRFTTEYPGIFVHCVDAVPAATLSAEIYQRFRKLDRVAVVPLNKLDELSRIDMAINIHSWSECTPAAIEFWLDWLVARRVSKLVVVPHTPAFQCVPQGSPAYPSTEHPSHPEFMSIIRSRGYRLADLWENYPPLPPAGEPIYLFELRPPRPRPMQHAVISMPTAAAPPDAIAQQAPLTARERFVLRAAGNIGDDHALTLDDVTSVVPSLIERGLIVCVTDGLWRTTPAGVTALERNTGAAAAGGALEAAM
jgi:putative sugar O-methyltransferase